MQSELLVVDYGGSAELLDQVPGREAVGLFEPFLVAQLYVGGLADDALVLPAQRVGLLAPQPALIRLHLAQPSLGARLLDDIEFAFGGEVIPRQALALREGSALCAGSACRACYERPGRCPPGRSR